MFLVRTFTQYSIYQIKHSRLKQLAPVQRILASNFCTTTISRPPEDEFDNITDASTLLEVTGGWTAQDQGLLDSVMSTMRVLPAFISESEEAALLAELEPKLRRMRYEFDHWDDAIHGYRETEVVSWGEVGEAVMSRVKALAFPVHQTSATGSSDDKANNTKPSLLPEVNPPGRTNTRAAAGAPSWALLGAKAGHSEGHGVGRPLRAQHVLDLAPTGHIKPHVDAVRFCGEVIAGLCLCSSAVMVLQHEVKKELTVRALLPKRSLYIMSGISRYDFNHAIPTGKDSTWRGKVVPKKRRVAIITRSEPKPEHITTTTLGDLGENTVGGYKREINSTSTVPGIGDMGDLAKNQGETAKIQNESLNKLGDSAKTGEDKRDSVKMSGEILKKVKPDSKDAPA